MKKALRTLILTIPVGEKTATGSINDIPLSHSVYVGATAKPAQNQIVRLGCMVNQNRIQDPVDVSWYDGKIGSIEERTLEIDFKGEQQLKFNLSTIENVADNDLLVEVVVWCHVNDRC